MIASAIFCLALNVFYETRGSSKFDQEAVAAVAINRAQEEHQSVCHVIKEPHQFSWTSRHTLSVPKLPNKVERKSWNNALKVARTVLYSKSIQERFANVTYYHTHYVQPRWDRHMRVAFVTNAHTYFYRSS
jgi:N-acetylmuramoyl-L-alanine amidase